MGENCPALWSNDLKEGLCLPATSAAKSGNALKAHVGFLLVGGQELPQSCHVKRAEREGTLEAPPIPATGIPGVGRQVPSKISQMEGHTLASKAMS